MTVIVSLRETLDIDPTISTWAFFSFGELSEMINMISQLLHNNMLSDCFNPSSSSSCKNKECYNPAVGILVPPIHNTPILAQFPTADSPNLKKQDPLRLRLDRI